MFSARPHHGNSSSGVGFALSVAVPSLGSPLHLDLGLTSPAPSPGSHPPALTSPFPGPGPMSTTPGGLQHLLLPNSILTSSIPSQFPRSTGTMPADMPTLFQDQDADSEPEVDADPNADHGPNPGSMITISDEFGSLALSVDGDDLVVAAKKRSAVKTKVDVLTLPVPSLLDGSDGVAVGMEVVPGPSAGDRTNTDRPAGGRVRPASAGAGRPKASPAATATGGVSTGGDSPPGDIPLHSLHLLNDSVPPASVTKASVDVGSLSPTTRYNYAHGRLLSGMRLLRLVRAHKPLVKHGKQPWVADTVNTAHDPLDTFHHATRGFSCFPSKVDRLDRAQPAPLPLRQANSRTLTRPQPFEFQLEQRLGQRRYSHCGVSREDREADRHRHMVFDLPKDRAGEPKRLMDPAPRLLPAWATGTGTTTM